MGLFKKKKEEKINTVTVNKPEEMPSFPYSQPETLAIKEEAKADEQKEIASPLLNLKDFILVTSGQMFDNGLFQYSITTDKKFNLGLLEED